jgi:hypothetical protein
MTPSCAHSQHEFNAMLAGITCNGNHARVRCVIDKMPLRPSSADWRSRFMTVVLGDEVVPSSVPDVSDVPLRAEVNIDGLEYMRIMRRIGIQDGDSVTSVSAFNSSI